MNPDESVKKGTLYLIPTPIGNLGDITHRAIEIMRSVDLLLAEDTRTTRKLLTHFDIKTPSRSYHGFNERQKLQSVLDMLLTGKSIGLVSDAGMPGISDPGSLLALVCHEKEIPVRVLPGPSAGITAMVASGFEIRGHLFEGFLPKKKKDRKERLKELSSFPGAIIVYESPRRMNSLLTEMSKIMGGRSVHIAREISKLHEEHMHGSIEKICIMLESVEPRGEYVIILSPLPDEEQRIKYDLTLVSDFRDLCSKMGLSTRDAADLFSAATGSNRSEVYRLMNR